MPSLLLEVLDAPVFGIILFLLFFALASVVAASGWLLIYLFKLMGERWHAPATTETRTTAASRAAALLLPVPLGFLLIAIVLVINKAAFFWAGISR